MPYTHLEVVGQLLPARISRVHGDEDSARWVQGDEGAFKVELFDSRGDGRLDAVYLLGYHGENLYKKETSYWGELFITHCRGQFFGLQGVNYRSMLGFSFQISGLQRWVTRKILDQIIH